MDELRCRQEALLATVDATLDPEAQQQLTAVQQRLGKVPEYREKCAALARAMASAERRRAALTERTSRLRAATAVTVATVSGSDDHGAVGSAAGNAMPRTPLFSESGKRFAYRVVYPGGVSVRSAPSIEATKTGVVLKAGTVLEASERLVPAHSPSEESASGGAVANDVFVRLGDGSGWVFEAKGSTPILERVTTMRLDRELGAQDSTTAQSKSDGAAVFKSQTGTRVGAENTGSSSEDTRNTAAVVVEPSPTFQDDVHDAVFEEGDV